jgi:outer membrane lipoprotein-sorting protein
LKLIFVFLSLASIFSIFALSGCIPSKPTEEVEILSTERLMTKLEANRRRIRSFEGNGTITIKSDDFNNSASFRIVLVKPDSLYLTITGPFGIELAQALVTRKDFIFYDALQNTAYKGLQSSDILRQIFKIDLSFGDIMDAFIGSVNLTNNLYRSPNNYQVIYDKYMLTYKDSATNNIAEYEVDVRNLGILHYLLKNSNGNDLLEGKYSNFELLETVAIPAKIEVMNRKQNESVVIDYKGMNANKKNIYIDFKLPDDASIIKW